MFLAQRYEACRYHPYYDAAHWNAACKAELHPRIRFKVDYKPSMDESLHNSYTRIDNQFFNTFGSLPRLFVDLRYPRFNMHSYFNDREVIYYSDNRYSGASFTTMQSRALSAPKEYAIYDVEDEGEEDDVHFDDSSDDDRPFVVVNTDPLPLIRTEHGKPELPVMPRTSSARLPLSERVRPDMSVSFPSESGDSVSRVFAGTPKPLRIEGRNPMWASPLPPFALTGSQAMSSGPLTPATTSECREAISQLSLYRAPMTPERKTPPIRSMLDTPATPVQHRQPLLPSPPPSQGVLPGQRAPQLPPKPIPPPIEVPPREPEQRKLFVAKRSQNAQERRRVNQVPPSTPKPDTEQTQPMEFASPEPKNKKRVKNTQKPYPGVSNA